MKYWLLVMLFAVAGAKAAKPNVISSCEAFAAKIESDQKTLSEIEASGIGDDSAPRATNRRLQEVVVMGAIQANLSVMQANKCALPQDPIGSNLYSIDAGSCAYARLKTNDKSEPSECDRRKWKRIDLQQ